ncbi:MAG: class I SAM-dependent RNA methyltransferase [Sphingomonas bacterium]
MTDAIIRVAARGDGITANGRHAALAAPGDALTAEGQVIPGPHHQMPPCRHFPVCGGCQLQHLDDESYAGFITDRIAGALAAQGLSAEIRPPALSPPRTRRRAALQAESKGGKIRIGFSEGSSHNLVDIQECWILTPALFALVAPLRGLLARFLKGNRRARLHLTEADQGIDLLIEGIEAEGLAAAEAITAFCQRHGVARFAIDNGLGPETRWEPEPVTIMLGGVPVPMPHGSFLQATREGEAVLIAAVREAVGRAGTIADLFAGLGTFALALPGRVYAGEAARDAIMSLKAAAAGAQRAIFTEHRDLFRRPLTTAECDRFDAVVLDPPRAGAREQVEQLADAKVPAIAYVSCNTSSFARDAEILSKGGYELEWVQPVGQFRWSTHVELAARFSR